MKNGQGQVSVDGVNVKPPRLTVPLSLETELPESHQRLTAGADELERLLHVVL